MSDESSRSARPYGQRRNDGAPIWWAALDRTDLPDNEVEPSAQRRWYEEAEQVHPQPQDAGHVQLAPAHRRGWLLWLVLALGAAVILGLERLADPDDTVLIVTLLICVPVALAAGVTIFIARRSS
jgi:hypothetical protein